MKYLCLVHGEDNRLDHLAAARWDKDLRMSGYLIVGNALEPAATAMTMRVRDGRVAVTEGPLAGAGGPLTAFALIDARDLNDAIRVVSAVPLARAGAIEVRPVRERRPPSEANHRDTEKS